MRYRYFRSFIFQLKLNLNSAGLLLVVVSLALFVTADDSSHAQSRSYENPRVQYNNNLLSVSAQDADLKNVLSMLAKKTDINVRVPDSLKRKITVKISKATLEEALRNLLKGLNHSIIYSGREKNQAVISEVLVLRKSKKSRALSDKDRRIANRIKAYERRIQSLNKRLSRIDVNSGRAKNYLRRIERIEKNIERLQKRLY